MIETNWLMSPQIKPPHFAADKDLILCVSCEMDELLHPLDPHLTRKTEVVAAEIIGLFSHPVCTRASPLTCLGHMKPEHQCEK